MRIAHDEAEGSNGHRPTTPAARPTRGDRDRDVIDRLVGGVGVTQIGRTYGFASPGASMRLVDRALDTVLPALSSQQHQRVDLARLDRLLEVWWPHAIEGDLDAASIVLATIEARTKLTGALDHLDDHSTSGRTGPTTS